MVRSPGVTVRREEPVGGGSISSASVLHLSDGTSLFLKKNCRGPGDLFVQEVRGLLALHATGGPRVPRPVALFSDSSCAYFLMEYIETGRKSSSFFRRFGARLATMHRENRQTHCGFEADNHIGATPQKNRREKDWHQFFREHRLMYQVHLARERGFLDSTACTLAERLGNRLRELLPPPDDHRPSILHGDLWGGNYLVDSRGEAVLIDPAVYYGHREADLAMTELFGGFGAQFYQGYTDEWPLEPGYSSRRDIYNLYHLLNHLNLFGMSYAGSCLAVLQRFR